MKRRTVDNITAIDVTQRYKELRRHVIDNPKISKDIKLHALNGWFVNNISILIDYEKTLDKKA